MSIVAMESDIPATKTVQDPGAQLCKKTDELLDYIRHTQARHASGMPFSFYTDYFELAKHIDSWKEVLLEQCGYITAQQESKWRFCGDGYDNYHSGFYQHKDIHACLSVLQQNNSHDKINEALIRLENEIHKIVEDSKTAEKDIHKHAALLLDTWLKINGGSDVAHMIQTYRTADNAEKIDGFIRCWYSGEFDQKTAFDVNDKVECMMYILLSERANFAATFGGSPSIVGYCRGKRHCRAIDYARDIASAIRAHFSEDKDMIHFLAVRLSPKNCMKIHQYNIMRLFATQP